MTGASFRGDTMLTLYAYPQLYGLEDNNPFGLKVFAFLRLSGLSFEHRHVLDTRAAPRAASCPILSTMTKPSATATRSSRI
jgi:hypothetical protein